MYEIERDETSVWILVDIGYAQDSHVFQQQILPENETTLLSCK